MLQATEDCSGDNVNVRDCCFLLLFFFLGGGGGGGLFLFFVCLGVFLFVFVVVCLFAGWLLSVPATC